MSNFIFFVILIWFVVANIKKGQKKRNTSVPNQPRRPKEQYGQQPQGKVPQNYAQNRVNQQQLKNRLQQKYGSRPQTGYPVQKNQKQRCAADDILERARSNVKENEQDVMRPVMGENAEKPATGSQMAFSCAFGQTGAFESQSGVSAMIQDLSGLSYLSGGSETMRQVEDLMIKGYSGELMFERDFVAEGVEMLNRFEIPG